MRKSERIANQTASERKPTDATENRSIDSQVMSKSNIDKLEELRGLLVTMTEQFQKKLSDISKNFEDQLSVTRSEINNGVEEKIQSLHKSLKEDLSKTKNPEDSEIQSEMTEAAKIVPEQKNPENSEVQSAMTETATRSTGAATNFLGNDVTFSEQSSSNFAGIVKEKKEHETHVNDRKAPSDGSDNNIKPSEKNIVYVRNDKLVDLPVFDGSPSSWPRFISQYNQTTKRHGYDDVDNNTRLNKSLIGNAKKLVDPLLIDPKNVPRIIVDLEKRFGRPELLAEEQISIIRNHPHITENRIHAMIELADKVRNCSNFLQTCGCESYLDNPLLVREISEKLPLTKSLEWIKYEVSLNRRATLNDLSDWMTEVSSYLERINPPSRIRETYDHNEKKRILHAQEANCLLCSKDHSLENCQEFKDMNSSSRFRFSKEKGVCFSCLKKGHPKQLCRNKQKCQFEDCPHDHHPLLHYEKTPSVNKINNQTGTNSETLFQMIPIKIFGPKGYIETFALFDGGADISILDENIANVLGINGPDQTLNVKWIDKNTKKISCKITDVEISGVFINAPVFKLQDVRIMKEVSLPTQSLNMEELKSKFEYLEGVPVESYNKVKPKMLLSLKEFKLMISSQPPKYESLGPIVTETKLGWMIYGPIGNSDSGATSEGQIMTIYEHEEDLRSLNVKVQKFINADEFGGGNQSLIPSEDDKKCLNILKAKTKKTESGYECGLTWKQNDIKLPNNFHTAFQRFQSIERKMEKDPKYKEVYTSKIAEYVEKGYAAEMSSEECKVKGNKTWYLPHFGVLNKNKPGKFRLVFDAAAKTNGVSLNTSLLSGPDLNKSLLSVLYKFREKKIGVCGDIREMFHQVQINKEDQDAQRFIFRENKNDPLKTYKMLVMTFGATCSPTTAQYIKNTNAQKYMETFPKAAEAIINHHYVDDYVCSFDSEVEALEVTNQVITIHKHAGFDLRGFISNSKAVAMSLNSIPATSELSMDFGDETSKILGLQWKLATDNFTFKANTDRIHPELLCCSKAPTKREVLSIVMSLFDPFGFAGNYTVIGKIILQTIWKEGIGWDDPIPDSLRKPWESWMKELPKVENISIPRCHSEDISQSKVQLHIFVDASNQAYAAVAYFRIISPTQKQPTVSFICSKNKCAPPKYVSIPRLELQAAVLGVRLMNQILENQNIDVNETFFWSDSTTVLYWIKNQKKQYKQFVGNRIAEILESTKAESWHKVASKENMADKATRATINYSEIFENNEWLHGPEWLIMGNWPEQMKEIVTPDIEAEIKCQIFTTVQEPCQKFIDFSRFSSFTKLTRTVAWILRFKETLTLKSRNKGFLDAREIRNAENFICKIVQREAFPKEYAQLSKGSTIEKSSDIHEYVPYLDDAKVMRVDGRIDMAPTIPISAKRPIIMPKDHHVSKLIAFKSHKACRHLFQEVIICDVRKKFWIPDLRTLVKKVKAECNFCHIRNAVPMNPLMGPHPIDRLAVFLRPFTYTGVDYFGPVQVTIGRRREKRWVAIFTCLTIRAVHTEIVENLSSDACILCIKNFINIRGIPKRMRSDNGSCFVGVNNEILKADDIFGKEKVQHELAIRAIEWKFNLPSNPSAGGCWERMVQMIKRILKQSLKEVAPKVETLRSFLIEASNIVNSRPLTHVPTSCLEEEPLTPNCFLLGETNNIQSFEESSDKIWTLRKQWRIANCLKNHFWKRFQKEYLPTLNKRSKDYTHTNPIKKGDIVLIADDNLSKCSWPRGIIIETFRGKDGVIRGVLLRSQNKEFRRPVCRLAVIGHSATLEKSSDTNLNLSTEQIVDGGEDVENPL